MDSPATSSPATNGLATINQQAPLVLGSASPRRRDLLEQLRLPIVVRPSDVPEDERAGESPSRFVERVTLDKLRAVQALIRNEPHAAVLVADTVVVVDDQAINKPRDTEHAFELLRTISGRAHTVITSYAIAVASRSEPAVQRSVRSKVFIREATDDELRRYAASGEGADKAGSYAIQGLGAFLVERIEGSYTNVVGLPVCEVVSDLNRLGLLRDFP